MQAGRPAQPSAADSPSSSHPRKGFCEASICEQLPSLHGRQGRPGRGPGQAHRHEPRGSAPRVRDHRGGDHPVPSRTRQVSPPSPRVLQRKAAGGQGVALAEGAFLCARAAAEAGRARGGIRSPRGPFLRLWVCARSRASLCLVHARSWAGSLRALASNGLKKPKTRWFCSVAAARLCKSIAPYGLVEVSFDKHLGRVLNQSGYYFLRRELL